MTTHRRKLTPEQRAELVRVRPVIAREAARVGPQHSGWDFLHDVDAMIAGKPARVGVKAVLDYVAELSEVRNS